MDQKALDLLMVSYDLESMIALKNFCIRLPGLTELVFFEYDYLSKLSRIEAPPGAILQVFYTVALNISPYNIHKLKKLFREVQTQFFDLFFDYL